MVYTPTPTPSISLDSITSLCKNILPFSFKKRRIPAIAAAEQRLSKQQSDNLKWQQDSFHQMLNLIGLCKEGMVPANEVATFRTHLLETLIASPIDHEPPLILKDKLVFLQELLYATCISEEEYHASKRPLLQRLAVQGAEIEARDIIIGVQKETSNEEWSDIDLKDDKCLANQDLLASKYKRKESFAVKKMKGTASVFGLLSRNRNGTQKDNYTDGESDRVLKTIDQNATTANPSWNANLTEKKIDSKSIFAMENIPSNDNNHTVGNKGKRKPLPTIFGRQQEGGESGDNDGSGLDEGKEKAKPGKKVAWLIDGLKRWKKSDEAYTTCENENPDGTTYAGKLVPNPVAEGPDTKQIKRKLHPNAAPTDFFVDKVLGDSIKKELSRIQRECKANDPNNRLTDDQIEAISTRLPVDKEDLKHSFPKSWCDAYGDIVLDVVRKEFKKHMKEMGSRRMKSREKQNNNEN